MSRGVTSWSVVLVSLLGASCAEPRVVTSPQAEAVQVATTDPPAGAENLGPIEAKDSEDCDLVSAKGTRENATARLKEAALRRGIDFVKLTKVREPFSDHDCYHKAYVMQGVGYRTKHAAPAPPASAIPALAASAAPGSPLPTASCEPPCSVGFVCEAGACAAACEPACAPTQICRADRVCVTPTP